MKQLISENRPLVSFVLILTILCGFYFFWFEPNVWKYEITSQYWGYIVHYTLLSLTASSVKILGVLGYSSEMLGIRQIDLYDSTTNIVVANVCLGLDMMFTLSALIVAYPGSWKDRLWFIPVGIAGIFTINVMRVVGLCLSVIFLPNADFESNHGIFNTVATAFIFLMFVLWVRRSQKRRPAD